MSAPENAEKAGSAKSLWIGVGLLFGLMAIAWAVLFTVASRNPVESVPLEHRSEP